MIHIFALIIFVLGLGMIVKGGDLFVDGAVGLAKRTGISTAIIGATIVSVATTLPELFVSTVATLEGFQDMAIGNALGSYICNIAFIIGLCAIIKPIKIEGAFFTIKGIVMIFCLIIFLYFGQDNIITYIEGIVMILLVGLFIIINILEHKRDVQTKPTNNHYKNKNIFKNGLQFIIGGLLVVTGSHFLVQSAVEIAEGFKIPTNVIGLTLLALGTSLPELVTALTATIKNQQNISIGNVIGANILNITLIIGVSAVISSNGLTVTKQTITLDIPMALVSALTFVGAGLYKKKISRLTGLFLIVLYLVYLGILF